MVTAFITAGLACLIAAVIGGGLKAFGIEIPALQSGRRQLGLGVLGAVLVYVGWHVNQRNAPNPAIVSATGGQRSINTTTRDHFRPLLQPFSGRLIQLTVCPDPEPVSFATALADFLKSTGLVTRIAKTPNACDANPVRVVAKDDNLGRVIVALLTQATGEGPILRDTKPKGDEDAVIVVGKTN